MTDADLSFYAHLRCELRRRLKEGSLSLSGFDPDRHPRGPPENAGQFRAGSASPGGPGKRKGKKAGKKRTAGGKPPKRPPAGTPVASAGQPDHHKQARDTLDHHLARHTHLPAAKVQEYRTTAHAVFAEMTPAAMGRFNQHVTGYRFFPDIASLNQALFPSQPPAQVAYLANRGYGKMGAYDPATGELWLDGPRPQMGMQQFPTRYGFAHEFAHAVDGPRREISWSKE